VAIVVVGAALRLWNIGGSPLWSDEALTAVIAQAPAWALATKPLDPSGPVYYWLHQLFVPGDAGPTAMRAISALCGILVIPMTYGIGRELADAKSALLAAALVSLSFPLIDHAQEARSYSLLTLLFCGVAWLAMRAAREEEVARRRLFLASMAAAAVAALYTHFIAFLFVGSVLLVLPAIVGRPESGLRRGEVYAVIVAVALFAAPEVRRTLVYITETNGFGWLRALSLRELVSLLAREWLPRTTEGALPAMALCTLLAAAVFHARKKLADAWSQRPGFPLLLVWLLQPLLLWAFSAIFAPVLMLRTIVPAWPAFALTLALALSGFGLRAWMAAAGASIALYTASLFLSGLSRPKEDWAGAARQITRSGADAVFVCAHWKASALLSALRHSPRPVLVFRAGGWRIVGGDRAGHWPRQYARSIWLAEMKRWLGPAPPTERVATELRSAILVESECIDPGAVAAVAELRGAVASEWLSGKRENFDPALGEPAPISVKTLDFGAPVRLNVVRSKD
jgi:mannosyltransferase